MDPRPFIVASRLREVSSIILVGSGKGGVGKSLVASTLSLLLSRRGLEVGLLDTDFHGPSCHLILGAESARPVEEKGLLPPLVSGVKLMSIAYFVADKPLPLRGSDITNILLELLAITRWGSLDFLIVDLPPGTGEEILDTVNLLKGAKVLVISTPSPLSTYTVARLVRLLKRMNVSIIGLLENMRIRENDLVRGLASEVGVRYLGWLPYDPKVDEAIGKPDLLIKTMFAGRLASMLSKILELPCR